jgi:hypothetical protein
MAFDAAVLMSHSANAWLNAILCFSLCQWLDVKNIWDMCRFEQSSLWNDCTMHNSWILVPLSHSASQWQFFHFLTSRVHISPRQIQAQSFPSDPLFPEPFHSFLCSVSSPFTVTSLSEAVYIPHPQLSSSQKPSLVFCFDRLLNRPHFLSLFTPDIPYTLLTNPNLSNRKADNVTFYVENE